MTATTDEPAHTTSNAGRVATWAPRSLACPSTSVVPLPTTAWWLDAW